MAASAPSPISTNPKPRDRPVSRSDMTCAWVTCPCWPNSCSRSSDVVLNGRFPTYRFFATPHPRGAKPRDTTNLDIGPPAAARRAIRARRRVVLPGVCARQARVRQPRQAIAMRTVLPYQQAGIRARPSDTTIPSPPPAATPPGSNSQTILPAGRFPPSRRFGKLRGKRPIFPHFSEPP